MSYRYGIIDVLKDIAPYVNADEGRRMTIVEECRKRWIRNAYLRDVSESMFKRHRDEMPPRFARRAEHFFSEHKRVREGISAGEAARRKALSKRLRKSTWRSSRGIGVLSRFVSVRVMMGRGLFEINWKIPSKLTPSFSC